MPRWTPDQVDKIAIDNGFYLSKLEPSDDRSLVKYLNDRDFYDATCSIPFPYTLDAARSFITSVLAYEKANRIRRDWAIRLESGEQIGGIGLLYNYGINAHRTELGYWLAKPHWNQGIMTMALRSFSNHIFQTRKVVRLEAMVFASNQASCKVLEKAGFDREGLLQKAYFKDDHYIDAYLYALVRG